MKRNSSYFNMFGYNATDINKIIHCSSTSKMLDTLTKRHRKDSIVGERFINWVKKIMDRNNISNPQFIRTLETNFDKYIKSGNRIKLRNRKQRGHMIPKIEPEAKKSVELEIKMPSLKTNEEYMAMITEGILMGQEAKKKIDEALEGIRINSYSKILDAKVLEAIIKHNV